MSTAFAISMYVLWALFLVMAFALFALYRYFGQMYINSPDAREAQGPEVGSHLLSTAGYDVNGEPVALPAAGPALVMFADTACDLCAYLRDRLTVLDSRASRISIVVFCAGKLSDVTAWAARVPSYVHVVPDHKASIANRYEVNGTPFVVSVDHDGRVAAKGVVNTGESLIRAADDAVALQVDTA
jgi:hypothetical protein